MGLTNAQRMLREMTTVLPTSERLIAAPPVLPKELESDFWIFSTRFEQQNHRWLRSNHLLFLLDSGFSGAVAKARGRIDGLQTMAASPTVATTPSASGKKAPLTISWGAYPQDVLELVEMQTVAVRGSIEKPRRSLFRPYH